MGNGVVRTRRLLAFLLSLGQNPDGLADHLRFRSALFPRQTRYKLLRFWVQSHTYRHGSPPVLQKCRTNRMAYQQWVRQKLMPDAYRLSMAGSNRDGWRSAQDRLSRGYPTFSSGWFDGTRRS